MKFSQECIILNTENYQDRIDFYGDVLGLKLIFEMNREAEKLTAFSLGNV
jgi:catechol 2,3-dioxygenase-like lactoylglutathione lyase family enzyme